MMQRKYIMIFVLLLFIKSFCIAVSAEEKGYIPVSFKQAADTMIILNSNHFSVIENDLNPVLDTNQNLQNEKFCKLSITEKATYLNPKTSKEKKKLNQLIKRAYNYINQDQTFCQILKKLKLSSYSEYDPDFSENLNAINTNRSWPDNRYITVFSDSTYRVNKVPFPRYSSKYKYPLGELILVVLQFRRNQVI
ncbi:MAG: hypothetical protein AB1782_18375 [Cyanobacteriota bacterium]